MPSSRAANIRQADSTRRTGKKDEGESEGTARERGGGSESKSGIEGRGPQPKLGDSHPHQQECELRFRRFFGCGAVCV